MDILEKMYNIIIGDNLQNVHLGNVPNWTKQDKGENDMDKARESALKVLYKIDVENGYSNIVLNDEIKSKKDGLNSKDIGLISEIVYGVIFPYNSSKKGTTFLKSLGRNNLTCTSSPLFAIKVYSIIE